MNDQEQSIKAIQDIKSIMERSSRFISLSGLSGVSAGICALIGAWLVYPYIYDGKEVFINEIDMPHAMADDFSVIFNFWPFWIMIGTFFSAFITAFIFTYLRVKTQGIQLWGIASKKVMLNLAVPLIIGAIFLFRMVTLYGFELFAPGCLIFYGLALINASKYTLGEVRYLGYLQIILGIINLWFIGYGLYFWAMGFGILHVIYGIVMWRKYERKAD